MITKDKLVEAGADKLADTLLSLYENHKDLQKHLNIVFAALDEDPKKLISILKKQVAGIKRSTRFIDYYAAEEVANTINHLRLSITEDLLPKSSEQAMNIMLSLIDLHPSVLDRADDSNGFIGDAFVQACSNLGQICEQVSKPYTEFVEIVFTRFTDNKYGIYDRIIYDFKHALGNAGLSLLQKELESSLAIMKEYTLKYGLQSIADCNKDIEGYIKACSFDKGPSSHDYLEIAKRLIKDWRTDEAMEWLERVDKKIHSEEHYKLKVEALELGGKYDRAQDERIAWFNKHLSPKTYGEILKHAKPEFKEEFQKSAILKALNFKDVHDALEFLTEIQEFEESAKLVYSKIDDLDGQEYYTLRPAADVLRNIDPLAATLLYRKMIQPVLENTKSKYYNYAAKDLVSCLILRSQILDWKNYQNNDSYLKNLQERHKRKISFWEEYKSALQKQAAKEAKQSLSNSKENTKN